MRAKLVHPAYLGGVYYAVGVHDFPEDTVLPSSSVVVDPDEVAASVCGDAKGERIPVGGVAPAEPDTLRGRATGKSK